MEDKNPFTLISSKEVYKNPWITVREDTVIRPGGKEGIFGVVDILPGVSVLPMDAQGTVYLTREFKYAHNSFMLECVNGGIEHGLSALETAKTELAEEIGGESNDWIPLGRVSATTVVTCHTNTLFLAKNTSFPNPPSPEEGEIIEIIPMPFAEALERIERGEIVHAATVALILKTHILRSRQ
jgi:8-oxo-dGTP pyrophosphatase MutT (NUDIX family)